MLNPLRIHGILSGRDRDMSATLLRLAAAFAEPLYATVMASRNRFYEQGIFRTRRLPRPAIAVGNITTGGTGKTPMVLWLAERLRRQGRHPAILMRGYASSAGLSDEQTMLDTELNCDVGPDRPRIIVQANPDRLAGGDEVLAKDPAVDVFILDDAFQHRRVARDVDIVLIDATNPFGFGRILPRGLLREPMAGLARAHAFVITRSNLAEPGQMLAIETALRHHNPSAPIAKATHAHVGLRTPAGRQPLAALEGKEYFVFAAIANPMALETQLAALPGRCVGRRFFADHHPYDDADIENLTRAAKSAGAGVLLTTEKDWAKLFASIRGPSSSSIQDPRWRIAIWRLELAMKLAAADESAILCLIDSRLMPRACRPSTGPSAG